MNQTPPSLTEFNTQATALIKQHGAAAFCASPGEQPDFTLFVDDDRVIAEPRNAPRHPYGIYCRINSGFSEGDMSKRVDKWLTTGEAYQEFLAMNVCRYNC
jgi:hypothetical protein